MAVERILKWLKFTISHESALYMIGAIDEVH